MYSKRGAGGPENFKASVEIRMVNGGEGNGSGRSEIGRGELEREYYEHLEAFKFLIEPPACFRNDEARQNFENKLNTLDFRRMNTVAIPDTPTPEFYEAGSAICTWNGARTMGSDPPTVCQEYRTFRFGRFCVGKMDECLDIERTVIDLFARAPILKRSKVEAVRNILFDVAKEGKTVRFKDEQDALEMSMNIEIGGNGASSREVAEETMRSCVVSTEIDVVDEVDEDSSSVNDARSNEDAFSDGGFYLPLDVAENNGKV